MARYRKTNRTRSRMSADEKKIPGNVVLIVKGQYRDLAATITRKCNHAWFELVLNNEHRTPVTLHSSYFRVASEQEAQAADPLAHLM